MPAGKLFISELLNIHFCFLFWNFLGCVGVMSDRPLPRCSNSIVDHFISGGDFVAEAS